MKPVDRQLDRLFRSAAQSAPEISDRLEHYTEKSILSHWRIQQLPVKEFWATEFFIPALTASAVLLLLVQLWNILWPVGTLSDNQFTLLAIYKIWNL